jgi:protein-S-isoprenylcysteine O-methyltransferase Ste14
MSLPSLGPRGEGWVLIQLVLLGLIGIAGVSAIAGSAATGRPSTDAVRLLAGGALLVGGLALVARGSLDLGRNLTPMPRPREGTTLVESGVYRHVRHPIYVGVVMAGAGWGVVTGSLAAVALSLVLLGFFDLKARREERWMMDHVPGYDDYRRRTKRFIPRLY